MSEQHWSGSDLPKAARVKLTLLDLLAWDGRTTALAPRGASYPNIWDKADISVASVSYLSSVFAQSLRQ